MYDALVATFQVSAVALVPVLLVIDAPFGRFAVDSKLNLNGGCRAHRECRMDGHGDCHDASDSGFGVRTSADYGTPACIKVDTRAVSAPLCTSGAHSASP